ncbi:beta-N-acetylhexosaminidase [Aliidiomarina quisquiliarum]|uniref:beta-N-acetylhexosaminidase n=1 Tax=Aliidiomarina quisquiliarum TaxID=2938947 RepID=UPI00208FFAA7|nr:beta-N-acetylhexosaminidase [Aliidiomarina quisquiliarum]MCO4321770.1 beta-N-acetylhexosaminidase [Aliidiomarina quisquiliarum]
MSGLIIDFEGLTLTAEDKLLLVHPVVQGVILFSRNYSNKQQLARLIAELRALCGSELLITVDHEGGRVQRFRKEFSELPAMADIGLLNANDSAQAEADAYDLGWLMAAELRQFDIDLSYAPVLDLIGPSTVIGNRAFSAIPEQVISLASSFIDGMAAAGMCCVGKHFPGHGIVVADSHIDIPIDERSFAEIQNQDLKVFKALAHKLDAVMPAHVIYSEVDALPAGFSPYWLQKVLREDCQFNGVIISDDLLMEGARVVGNVPARAQAAYQAGGELLLVCNNRQAVKQVLEEVETPLYTRNAAQFLLPQIVELSAAQMAKSQATLAKYNN